MSTIICFAVLMLCYSTLADRQQVLDLGSQMCPYTNFCRTDAWKSMPNDTDDEPCCFSCSCDDECFELDNCCPDKDFKDTTRPLILPCKDSYLDSTSLEFGQYGLFYRVIDTCPVSESILESKCNNKNITSLEDFTWVSDNTGKIYQNIHCATCHGIEEPTSWHIQATCFDIMKASFNNFREMLLSESCHIRNTPPKDLQLITLKYACTEPKLLRYNSCNESGLMKTYDHALEIACEQSTWPFNLGRHTFDKNIFCLLCNQELPQFFQELCFPPGGRDPTGPYTFIIDYTVLRGDASEEESNCGLDEMFDEFLGLCRKMWCPLGTAPFYGRCKQLVSKINGLTVNVEFYLDIIWNQTSLTTFRGHDTIGSLIYAQFIELADLNSDCDICHKIIYLAENSEPDLVLVLTFKFSSECEYGLALAKVADMRDKVIETHVNRTVTVTLLVRSDKQPPKWQWLETVFYDPIRPANCKPHFTLSFDDITCPKIELIYTEIDLFSAEKNKEKDIFASFFIGSGSEQNITRVSVCLDIYISAMSRNCALLSYRKMSVEMLLIQLFVLAVIRIYLNK